MLIPAIRRNPARSTNPRRRPNRNLSLRLETLEDRLAMSADAVLDWNAIALAAVQNDYAVGGHPDQGGPTRTARALAIVHVAMYDAAVAIDHRYASYLFDYRAVAGTSMDAAVSQAAHDTLVALFPQQTSTFDAALTSSLADIPARSAHRGMHLGSRIAHDILAARANDGADGPMDYTPGDQPGEYRPDPLHPDQMIISPDWNDVTPFVITNGPRFAAPPPPALTSQAYADAFNEMKSLGADGVNSPTTRTAEQTEIGIFWAYDGVPQLGTPPRLYNQITRVIAEQQGNTEVENARLFALVNVAMQDVGVVIWTTKYAENFWRPITAIREADAGTGPSGLGDGNPNTSGDPNWTPLGAPADNGLGTNFTPGFPAYSSGHAGFGAAVFGAIRNFYHTDNIAFSFTSDEFNGVTRDASGNVRPAVSRSYVSLSQAAEENAISRLYLGVHWSFDMEASMVQGTRVANYVSRHFALPAFIQRCFLPPFHHGPQDHGFGAGAVTSAAVDQVFATSDKGAGAQPASQETALADTTENSTTSSIRAPSSDLSPIDGTESSDGQEISESGGLRSDLLPAPARTR